MVMLHGCGQDANSFAASTRMNRIAMRERFLVLYPEQDRLANAQGCWNWFDTASGRAYGEAALIMKAIDQVCLLYPVDRARVAMAGLSAGASMAALLVTRHPERFKAVVMHSGIPPGTAHSTLSALGAMHGHRATMPLAATPSAMAAALAAAAGDPRRRRRRGLAANGQAAVQVWADAAGARASAPQRAARQALPDVGHRLQAQGQHRGHAGRRGRAGPRVERRRRQQALQRRAGAGCVAHGVGVCGQAVSVRGVSSRMGRQARRRVAVLAADFFAVNALLRVPSLARLPGLRLARLVASTGLAPAATPKDAVYVLQLDSILDSRQMA